MGRLHLLHLLELLHLLKLQEFQGIGSGLHACQEVGGGRSRLELGLLLHVVSGLRRDYSQLLHEFDDGHFHFSKDTHDFGVGHDH